MGQFYPTATTPWGWGSTKMAIAASCGRVDSCRGLLWVRIQPALDTVHANWGLPSQCQFVMLMGIFCDVAFADRNGIRLTLCCMVVIRSKTWAHHIFLFCFGGPFFPSVFTLLDACVFLSPLLSFISKPYALNKSSLFSLSYFISS